MKIKLIFSLFTFVLFFSFSNAQEDEINDWHHKSYDKTKIYGVGTDAAYEFLNNKKPVPVIVAVLDGGIDLEHEDLVGKIWINKGEIPGNNIDDDNNGYVDDINGWNFIGGKDGNVTNETLEVTRLYAKYKKIFEGENEKANKKNKRKMSEAYEEYREIKKVWQKKYAEAKASYEEATIMESAYSNAFDNLKPLIGKKLTKENISSFNPETNDEENAKKLLERIYSYAGEENMKNMTLNDIQTELMSGIKHKVNGYKYMYNPDFEPRSIVGDDYEDTTDKNYGNNNVDVGDVLHGTHVSGIIGAVRNNDLGGNGVAGDFVKIMSLRMVADGDERDKDVANAIIYAVDNGARVINMSFGKGYSPQKEAVWKAMQYAEEKGVLLVHAAGNSNEDIDVKENYPTNYKIKKGEKLVNNWLEVGASTRNSGNELKASFSNIGKIQVDVFAPGLEIYATAPDNEYKSLAGTSMAAPVVSGAAAVLFAYFPKLTAKQVREILVSTVNVPKSDRFGEYSNSGGVIDIYKAVEKAEQMSR